MKKIYLFILILVLMLTSGCGVAVPEIVIFENMSDVQAGTDIFSFVIIGKEGEIILEALAEHQKDLTAAEASEKICRLRDIPIVFSGLGSLRYVRGINGLFEFDEGPESGWIYTVNGDIMGISSGSYIIQPDDNIVWHYTLDLGKDIGAEFGD
jgi:hypothetical protein